MSRLLRQMSGNEAVARGAWEAGASVASAYPGTPSTEIIEEFSRFPGVYAEWAPNEKVALDVAIGGAYAGRRSFAAMKHVGLNVAADSLMYAAMTGAEAGLVIISADDPAMHSSQNEQDNRTFAKFARIPCLEPSDSQEAKDLTAIAFQLSEQYDTPVLLRLTTRICHSSSAVSLGERTRQTEPTPKFPRSVAKYVMIPAHARLRHPVIEQRIRDIAEGAAATFPHNRVEHPASSFTRDASLGIITAGVAYQYAREVFPNASILRLGLTWPLSERLIRDFAASVQRLIVIEELDPFIEEAVRLLGIRAEGKSIFPLVGELDQRVVRECAIQAGLLPATVHVPVPEIDVGPLPARPPVLCPGCPHRSTFYVLNKLKVLVNGDIGCYTLGLIPPLSAIHTTGCMGAGIGVAHGAAKAGSPEHHVAVIGDSTFFHTGIPALINTVYNRSPVVTVIMDNRVTGMTGHQDNPGTGRTLQGQETTRIELEPLVRALGVQHIRTVPAYDVEAVETTLRDYLKLDEPAVLITEEPCPLAGGAEARKRWVPLDVISEQCNGCTLCFRLGCPAILKSKEVDARYGRPKALIDSTLCTGCEVCAQVCPRDAICFRATPCGPDETSVRSPSSRRVLRGEGFLHPAEQSCGAILRSNPSLNFLLAGVGGQGTILASDLLANVGMAAGYQAKRAEVHGMSQRGGSVTSHVRWGSVTPCDSPLVVAGEADVYLAFEKLEALRSLNFLRPGALAVINLQAIAPVTVTSGSQAYPDDEQLYAMVSRVAGAAAYVDGPAIAERLGNMRVVNVVLLGALSALLEREHLARAELTPALWLEVIGQRVPPKYVDLNRRAFEAGRDAIA